MRPGVPPGAGDLAYNEYLKAIDPSDHPEIALALASDPDQRFSLFLDKLSTPQKRKYSIAAVAQECNIRLGEFMDWMQRSGAARAVALAQIASPKITQDLAQDAMSGEGVCPKCDGLLWIGAAPGWPLDTPGYRKANPDDVDSIWIRDCPECARSGRVRRVGDQHARDKVLEMAGLINKKGPGIAIVQNFGGSGMQSAIPRLSAITVDLD